MKQKLLIVTVVIVVLIPALYAAYQWYVHRVVAEVTMLMKPGAFEPEELVIKKNTRVIFKNEDKQNRWPASNIHPTHGIYPEFDPQRPLVPGESWSFIFDKTGTWKCHDHILPRLTCNIRVE